MLANHNLLGASRFTRPSTLGGPIFLVQPWGTSECTYYCTVLGNKSERKPYGTLPETLLQFGASDAHCKRIPRTSVNTGLLY